jgi:acetyl esterase/lipase
MTINRRDLIALSTVALGGIAVGADRATKANSKRAQVLRLWPNTPPGAAGKLPQERFEERIQGGVSNRVIAGIAQPQLECVRPQKPNGAALLVIPGGGYVEEWIDKEGFEIAERFAAAGITSFILRYRLPREGWTQLLDAPLQDAQRAVRVMRARAWELKIDPERICAMGFSAGAHLAASLSTRGSAAYSPVDDADVGPVRPDLCALLYPLIDMSVVAHNASVKTAMFGPAADEADILAHTPTRSVDPETPATFLVSAFDDPLVSPQHSIGYAMALRENRVAAELHLFEEGGHGFGVRQPASMPVAAWPSLFLTWAARHGYLQRSPGL